MHNVLCCSKFNQNIHHLPQYFKSLVSKTRNGLHTLSLASLPHTSREQPGCWFSAMVWSPFWPASIIASDQVYVLERTRTGTQPTAHAHRRIFMIDRIDRPIDELIDRANRACAQAYFYDGPNRSTDRRIDRSIDVS